MSHYRSRRLRAAEWMEGAHRKVAPLNDAGGSLSKILSGLDHLDLTDRVSGKEVSMAAHGGYCDVFIGYLPLQYARGYCTIHGSNGNMKVAIKRLRIQLKRHAKIAKSLARELAIWSKMDHPNVLLLLGYMLEKDYPSLISEWVEYGTVRDFLGNHPEWDITDFALGIAQGLKYMHEQDIVHSDMKADNVLVNKNFQPLICDFGISRMLDSSQSFFVSTTHDDCVKGSTRWMAVELLAASGDTEPKHSKKTDVWAYGMTLYQMLSRELPYAHLKHDVHVLLAVMKGELPKLPTFRDIKSSMHFDSYLRICQICDGCWAESPGMRLTMGQITQSLLLLTGDKSENFFETLHTAQKEKFPLRATSYQGASGRPDPGSNSLAALQLPTVETMPFPDSGGGRVWEISNVSDWMRTETAISYLEHFRNAEPFHDRLSSQTSLYDVRPVSSGVDAFFTSCPEPLHVHHQFPDALEEHATPMDTFHDLLHYNLVKTAPPREASPAATETTRSTSTSTTSRSNTAPSNLKPSELSVCSPQTEGVENLHSKATCQPMEVWLDENMGTALPSGYLVPLSNYY